MRRVLFFIHIPKTAGTACRQMLRRNLRSRLIEVPHVFLEGPIEGKRIRHWLNQDTAKLGVASHRLSLDLPLDDCETFSGYAIAVIRDPIDWLASHYHYTRKPGIISFAKTDQFYSIEDYVESIYAQKSNPGFQPPSQARTLLTKSHTIDNDILKLIEKRRLFLIPQESLLEGFAALSMRFPELLRDSSIAQLNVNVRPQSLLSADTHSMITELLADDFRLHSLATENLTQLTSELDASLYHRLVRNLRMKSHLRGALVSPIQSLSERANRLVQFL